MNILSHLSKLSSQFSLGEITFNREAAPAGESQIRRYELETQGTLPSTVRSLYSEKNGSDGEIWGAISISEQLIPLEFTSIEESLDHWRLFRPYDQSITSEFSEEEPVSDSRIAGGSTISKHWVLISRFNLMDVRIYADLRPGPKGDIGQVIARLHGPDRAILIANSIGAYIARLNAETIANKEAFLELGRLFSFKNLGSSKRNANENPPWMRACDAYQATGNLDYLKEFVGKKEQIFDRVLLSGNISRAKRVMEAFGIDIEARRSGGGTRLIYFSSIGKEAAVYVLLQLGADPMATDDLGLSAYEKAEWANAQNKEKIQSYLTEHKRRQ